MSNQFEPPADPLPSDGPGDPIPGDPGYEYPRYTRDPGFDKRIPAINYASDAWRDQLGLMRWVAVGVDPNTHT